MNDFIKRIFSLEGYIAIVTGASRGIGSSIANGLSESGATVFGISRTPPITDTKINHLTCDIRDTELFHELCKGIYNNHGKIDVLVNSAGITIPLDDESNTLVSFQDTLLTNLAAAYSCCNTVKSYMAANNRGSIINISSIGALFGFPDNPGYAASKGGLSAMTRALALDYGSYGIRVNNILPGYIKTDMTINSYNNPEKNKIRVSRTIIGRWGEPDDLIGAAIFLSSSASSYITGTDIIIDGGWSARGL